jgi:hypothetical protein
VYELQGVRSWRNFEATLSRLFHHTDVMNMYRKNKEAAYTTVVDSNESILALLGISRKRECMEHYNISEEDYDSLAALASRLQELELERIVRIELERLEDIEMAGLFKESSISDLRKFISKIYPERLKGTLYNEANRELASEIKQAVRAPNEQEISHVLQQGSGYLKGAVWRAYSCFWLTYSAGLAASYADDILGSEVPNEAFLGYYLFFGAYMNYVSTSISRVGSVVNLQGLIKELERDPRINAMDAWLQWASHLRRTSLAATGLGGIVGLSAAMASGYLESRGNHLLSNALLFGIEAPAIAIRSWAQADWIKYFNGLSRLYSEME